PQPLLAAAGAREGRGECAQDRRAAAFAGVRFGGRRSLCQGHRSRDGGGGVGPRRPPGTLRGAEADQGGVREQEVALVQKLTLGPLFFHWPAETRRAFYER